MSKCRMDYQNVIFLLLVNVTGAKIQFHLPKIIYEQCPYSDICNRTASMSLNDKGFVPCCSSCRCDDKCGLRLDCCFDFLDKYRLRDNGVVACVNPVIGKMRTDSTFVGTYWMIQTCKKETSDDVHNDRNVPCDHYDEKGQNVVKPVSSKETGYIYVNAECAKCNNVTTFIKWDYLFVAYYPQRGSLAWEIGNNLENRVGAFVYIPPQGENWSMKRCFNEILKDTCGTNSTFERLCQTMHARYQTVWGSLYKNLFCALCDRGNQKTLFQKCRDYNIRTSGHRFTVLIDSSVKKSAMLLKSVITNKSLKSDCGNEMKIYTDVDSCLPIYCPDGMLMTPTGCRYFIQRWYIPVFFIQFKLWAIVGYKMPIAALKALSPEQRQNPLLWTKLPCRQVETTVMEVFYEIGKENNDSHQTVESFIVRIWKLAPTGIDPSVTIPTLRKCLKYNWYIKTLVDTYPFRATLDKQVGYIQDGIQTLENKLLKLKEDVPRSKLYERIATGPASLYSLGFARTAILKTFFCHQVILLMDQVEVLIGGIRILSNNVTLGNNEFALNLFRTHISDTKYINDHNKTTFSVCLEDFDKSYYQRNSKGHMSAVRDFMVVKMVLYFAIKGFVL